MKCKYYKVCKEYNPASPLCNSNAGNWNYDSKANCWVELNNKRMKICA